MSVLEVWQGHCWEPELMTVASHHLGSFLNQCLKLQGCLLLMYPLFPLCPFFAFDKVSDKIHLTENSTDLIFQPLPPLNLSHTYLTARVEEKTRTWCLLCSMGLLDLKITFPCLRPELNFNLQTLVCICDGLGLLACGQQVHITKGPDPYTGAE